MLQEIYTDIIPIDRVQNTLPEMLADYRQTYGNVGFVLRMDLAGYIATITKDKLVSFVFRKVKNPVYRWQLRDAIRAWGKEIDDSPIAVLLLDGYLSTLDYTITKQAGCKHYHRSINAITIVIPTECSQPDGTVLAGEIVANSLKDRIAAILSGLGDAGTMKTEIIQIQEFTAKETL